MNTLCQYILFVVAGIIGVLLGGYLLPIVYSLHLAMPIAEHLPAWIGSLGTLGTLVFLIRQNTQTAKKQLEAESRQQKYEKHQRELWVEQKKVLGFEKYQAHQNYFNQLLDSLEHAFTTSLKFTDRFELYSRLFPNNTFENLETKIEILSDGKCAYKDLTDILNYRNSMIKTLNQSVISAAHAEDYIENLVSLISALNITFCTNNRQLGDLYFEQHFITNAYNPIETAEIVNTIISRLLAFSGHPELDSISHLGDRFIRDSTLEFMFDYPRRDRIFTFDNTFGQNPEALYKIYKIFHQKEFIQALSRQPSSPRHELDHWHAELNKMTSLLNSPDELADLKNSLSGILSQIGRHLSTESYSTLNMLISNINLNGNIPNSAPRKN